MFINKIGYQHAEIGMNCQDYGIVYNDNDRIIKVICDGCGEMNNSEVGSELFIKIFEFYSKNDLYKGLTFADISYNIMHEMTNLFNKCNEINKVKAFSQLFSFTIIGYEKYINGNHNVYFCGDGYIIYQDKDNKLCYQKIDNGEYPKYYIYKYIPAKYLLEYKDGVNFDSFIFDADNYKKVGIASDGLRYIINTEDEDIKNEFESLLLADKEVAMKRFINRNHKIFKDDITLIW
jgi:hypothetical protein